MKKTLRNKKGFTLAELLIVVAIIAVLVAIAIPIFTSQLEKSRDAVSVANLRAAYAEASTQYLTGTDSNGAAITGNSVTISDVEFKGETAKDVYSGLAKDLPFAGTATTTEPAKGSHEVTFTWDTTKTGKDAVSAAVTK